MKIKGGGRVEKKKPRMVVLLETMINIKRASVALYQDAPNSAINFVFIE